VLARIGVSGVGLVSGLGTSAGATFRAILAGERCLAPLTLFDPGEVRSRIVAEVRGLDVADIAPRDQAALFSRTDAMAVAAAREAVSMARLPAGARVGVVLGGTAGGMFETENLLSSPELPRLSALKARDLLSYPVWASVRRVSAAVGGAALERSICSACSGGAIALVQAVAWLRAGRVDYVLAGGADALCRLTVLGFNALGATDPEPCRPFDQGRAGLNLGEGAAVLVLEREENAATRGASVLAWLDGYAVGAEAHHITHPEPGGKRASSLLRAAMDHAGWKAEDVGYVNAHGTGTLQNDAMEASALLEVFGEGARTWISSSKGQLGHTLGAAGAVEAVLTVLALRDGRVLPSVGLESPAVSGLRYAPSHALEQPLDAAISSSFGFGGMSCVLAFAGADRPFDTPVQRPAAIALSGGCSFGGEVEPVRALDPERSRRFDSASSLAAAGASSLAPESPSRVGLIVGTAFGNVERTMAFLSRARDRGSRFVAPAEFPHLVPSAPAGNASIYGGLTGPVFAVCDVAHCGEAAVAAACDLLELGVADELIAGAVAPRDAIVEAVLAPLLEPASFQTQSRGHGAGFVRICTEDRARAAGAPWVRVLSIQRGDLSASGELRELPPSHRPQEELVVLGAASQELRRALSESSWAAVKVSDLATEHGYHEALGALGLVEGFRSVVENQARRVLVLSGGPNHFEAILLGCADPSA